MMYEILMLVVILACFWAISRLYDLRKHDRVLYELCQVRRDLMGYLKESGLELSREDYLASRELVDFLNRVIRHYAAHKTVFFNFRRMRREIGQTTRQMSKVNHLASPAVLDDA